MTRIEFMVALEKALTGFPREAADQALAYYSEMLADLTEDGVPEEEAVESLGPIEEIRENILAEMPMRKLVKAKAAPKKHIGTSGWILLILASPVWLPLLIALAATVLSLYISLWAVVLSLWAADLGLAVGGIGLILSPFFHVDGLLFCIGAGLICLALSVFLFFAVLYVTRAFLKGGKRVLIGIKKMFVK